MNAFDLPTIPHSMQAEQSVLGGLMLDEKAFDKIAYLEPWHFFDSANREIYAAIRKMATDGKSVDIVSLTDELGERSSATGGIVYLADLQRNTPSASNVNRYAEIVQEKAMLRSLLEASNSIASIAWGTDGSVQEKINKAQSEVMRLSESSGKRDPLHIREVLNSAMEAIDHRSEMKIDGLLTGCRDLDSKLNGMKNGELIIIAARPGMGKSTLAVQVAAHVASQGKPALILSQEMSYQQLADRLIASAGRVDLGAITSGKLCEDGWNRLAAGIGKLYELPLYLDDQAALTISDVCSKARMLKRKHGLSVLVIDYLQLMSGSSDNRNSAIEEISRGLKSLAKELHIPVIALSQLSRECEKRTNRRPMLSDLRDSGAIEQDADVVMFIYRDEEYNPDTQEKGIAEILIRKNRQGKTGDVRMAFNGEYSRFDDLAHGYEPLAPVIKRKRGNDDL